MKSIEATSFDMQHKQRNSKIKKSTMWACIVTKIKHTQYSNSSEDTHPSPDQTVRMDPSDLQA